MFGYLNGKPSGQHITYVTDILQHPDGVPTITVDVPADAKVYGSWAGQKIPVVTYLLYPTTKQNNRPDYRFPYKETGDNVFPRMQRPGEKPLFPENAGKLPLIVYTGGFNAHGLWHLDHLKFLASHGYLVLDLFHADGRSGEFLSSMAVRPLEVRAALDYILAHPDFGPVIDRERIGLSGASAGGATLLSVMGGFDPEAATRNRPDPRVKAGFGLVPAMGSSFGIWPFKTDAWYFGRDFSGLRGVRRPFLGVYAQNDVNVTPRSVEAGIRQLGGPASGVMLDGEAHLLSNASNSDVYTWELTFFDAWLRDDLTARSNLEQATSVRGGVNDHRTIHHPAR